MNGEESFRQLARRDCITLKNNMTAKDTNKLALLQPEILAEHTNLSVEELIQLNADEFGYATPK